MRYVTQIERIGEWVSEEVDWEHKDLNECPSSMSVNPTNWMESVELLKRLEEAFKSGGKVFVDLGTMTSREVLKVGMYDGWPYWSPYPTIMHIGPTGKPEMKSFTQIRDFFIETREAE